MKAFLLIVALGVFGTVAWGQADVIVRQRAKDIANQNNARQGVPPPAPAPVPTTPATPPPNPALNATLQNIADLERDLTGIATNSASKTRFVASLNGAAQGTKPSPKSVSKLADDLAGALAGKKVSHEQQHKLAQYCHAIANGAHLSAAQEQSVIDGTTKALQAAEVTGDDVSKIVADMKAIIGETK